MMAIGDEASSLRQLEERVLPRRVEDRNCSVVEANLWIFSSLDDRERRHAAVDTDRNSSSSTVRLLSNDAKSTLTASLTVNRIRLKMK